MDVSAHIDKKAPQATLHFYPDDLPEAEFFCLRIQMDEGCVTLYFWNVKSLTAFLKQLKEMSPFEVANKARRNARTKEADEDLS